ncbi:MAG: sensor histidine kinase, partial [Syntrophothermus sp.]
MDLKEGRVLEFNSSFRDIFNTYGSMQLKQGVQLSKLTGVEDYVRLTALLTADGSVASKSVIVHSGGKEVMLHFSLQQIPGCDCAEGFCSDKSISQSVLMLEERIAKRNGQLCRTNKKLQASLAEKDVMLKEIHHRVKNNLQIIHSILNLQSRYNDYPEILRILKEVQDRIKAMAFVHDCLCRSNDLTRVNMKVYINEIIMYLYQACLSGDKDINIQTDIGQIELDLQRSITCGIIYNELISNSLKHAFTNSASGWLKVAFEEQGEFYTISVCDDGKGIS